MDLYLSFLSNPHASKICTTVCRHPTVLLFPWKCERLEVPTLMFFVHKGFTPPPEPAPKLLETRLNRSPGPQHIGFEVVAPIASGFHQLGALTEPNKARLLFCCVRSLPNYVFKTANSRSHRKSRTEVREDWSKVLSEERGCQTQS